jgi:precorrin-2/cobalt-factor-2 C20-methyltransferase
MTTFKLTAVGLGPGDPELITMKGRRAIRAAQLIFVPRSRTGEQSLALRIAQSLLEAGRQHIVELPLPMTRNSAELLPAWQAAADQIAAQFAEYAEAAASLTEIEGVYLLLGDPLLYGTFTYIWEQLVAHHPRIEIDIVPGVTSFAASAARAQVPLSTTSDRVAILPASYETDAAQLRRLLADFDTVILMKVGRVLPQILEALAEMDLLDSTVYAERVGMPEERIVFGPDLATLRNERRPYLSLLIVKRQA